MKKTFILIFAAALTGCGSKKSEVETPTNYEKFDTIIAKSASNITTVTSVAKQSDSTITKKVDGAVHKIQKLETEVKELKEENAQLKEDLNDAKSTGKPYKFLPSKNQD